MGTRGKAADSGTARADFTAVYRDHVTPVWRYVRLRLPADSDADDLTGDVFAEAMRSWPTYDAARGPVRAWLIGIARHRVADWWARHTREVPVDFTATDFTATGLSTDTAADDSLDPESVTLRREAADVLRRSLGVLTPREREAVALRFATEMSSEEIGGVMGISAPAARMLVHRGLTKLREVMPR